MMITDNIAAAGLLAGVLGVILNWRHRSGQARNTANLREEFDKRHRECLQRVACIAESLDAAERNAQASLELLRDGRLGMPARARALRMLRSGMSPDTAATELGLAKSEVRLLERVVALLAPR